MKGAYFGPETAARAVRLAMPMMQAAMASREAGDSGFLHIVVMNPLLPPGQSAFEPAILYEENLGDRADWDADYAAYARAKARLSWRSGMAGHRVCEVAPQLLAEQEQPLWGSVSVDGVAVGVSGAYPWFDEAFAATVAHTFIACVKAARAGTS